MHEIKYCKRYVIIEIRIRGYMDVHEYQAKQIFKRHNLPVPAFEVASNLAEVQQALDKLGIDQAVLKVQVHAGGRGKAGGVKVAKSREEALKFSQQLIGMRIVNEQTGKDGLVSHQILISPLVEIEKEYYLSFIIDRSGAQVMLIISPEGGMDIEEVSAHHPEKILKIAVPYHNKLKNFQILEVCKFMGWTSPEIYQQAKGILENSLKAFLATDASLLEINPLVLTKDHQLIALDAKLSLDDNALFRQTEWKTFYDPTQIPENEVKANQFNLAYVALDGNIGCMVNGAGLAMATMDLIKLHGGMPANFLDVGGGASKEKVTEGFKILLSDPQVKAILVNIFGGIMDCAILAAGIVEAVKELSINVPLVVRMEGTNVQEGKKILEASGLKIVIAQNLGEAAQKAVSLAL